MSVNRPKKTQARQENQTATLRWRAALIKRKDENYYVNDVTIFESERQSID